MSLTAKASANYITQRHRGSLYPKRWEHCSWKERSVRVMDDVKTLALHLAIAVAATAAVAAAGLTAYYIVPIFVTPAICCTLSIPAIGFSSACWTNTILGSGVGLATSYLATKYFAAPPQNTRKSSQEWPETRLLRFAARKGLLMIGGALLGNYTIGAGHWLGLLKPWS